MGRPIPIRSQSELDRSSVIASYAIELAVINALEMLPAQNTGGLKGAK